MGDPFVPFRGEQIRLWRPHEIADSGAVVNLDQPRITSSVLCGAVGVTLCLAPC